MKYEDVILMETNCNYRSREIVLISIITGTTSQDLTFNLRRLPSRALLPRLDEFD